MSVDGRAFFFCPIDPKDIKKIHSTSKKEITNIVKNVIHNKKDCTFVRLCTD
jgi:hypothetical protein